MQISSYAGNESTAGTPPAKTRKQIRVCKDIGEVNAMAKLLIRKQVWERLSEYARGIHAEMYEIVHPEEA